MNKRSFIKTSIAGIGGLVSYPLIAKGKSLISDNRSGQKEFELPELPYSYNSLEPYIDEKTVMVHHSKHHAAYTKKFNAAVKEAGITGKNAREILKEVSKYPLSVRNNGGGYLNHKLYWKFMSPEGGGTPDGVLLEAINRDFVTFEDFKNEFSTTAKQIFGSGWAWLIVSEGRLKVTSTPNQDNPIMDIAEVKGSPILCIDVWEHAYYLKYQNRRAEYVDAFWNIVNWDMVSKKFKKAIS
jgi:Fe-Mn family superoxide dismutase